MIINSLESKSRFRRAILITVFTITGIGCAALYNYTRVPEYRSTVSFKVYAEKPSSALRLFGNEKTANTEELSSVSFLTGALSETDKLVSSSISYDFRTDYSYYSFPYEINYAVTGNKDFNRQDYIIRSVSGNGFTLECNSAGVTRTKSGKFGEELIDNNISITLTRKENKVIEPDYLLKKPVYSFSVYSPSALARELVAQRNGITVIDNEGLITLSVQTKSPHLAGTVANTLAKNFIASLQPSGAESDAESTDAKIEQFEKQIINTEEEIAKYKQQNLLTDVDANASFSLSVYRDLKLQQTSLELQMAALENLTNYLRKNRTVNNSQVEYGVINDPDFSSQLTRLNEKYEEKNKGNNSPELESEIENLKVLISERILNTRKNTAIQMDLINAELAKAERMVSRLPEQANTLAALERKMQLDKRIYDKLIEKKASFIVDNATGLSVNRIIKPASLPTTPVNPIAWFVLVLGAITGFVTGLLTSNLIRSVAVSRIRNRQELKTVSAVPYIATIPTVYKHNNDKTAAVKNLTTSVLMKPDVKVIAIASADVNAGKTFIATRLAQSLAALDKKVLVLDMNVDEADVADSFGVSHDYCLADVIEGSCDLHDAICITPFPNLEILSPGSLQSGINTLLSWSKKDEILNSLREIYDFIIIDTAVTNDNSEAVAMMMMSDLNLFIVRANSSRKDTVGSAESTRKAFNINNMYLVLNADTIHKVKPAAVQKTGTNGKPNRTRKIRTLQPPSVLRRIALWFY